MVPGEAHATSDFFGPMSATGRLRLSKITRRLQVAVRCGPRADMFHLIQFTFISYDTSEVADFTCAAAAAAATTVAGGSPAWCGESLMAWVRQPPRASRPVPTIFRELGHATPQSTAPRVVTDDELYCVLLPTSDFRIQVSAHHG